MKAQRATRLRTRLRSAADPHGPERTTPFAHPLKHFAAASGSLLQSAVLGGLLLPATALHAAMRNTHTPHHAPPASAGKAVAHVVRDEAPKSSRHSAGSNGHHSDALHSVASAAHKGKGRARQAAAASEDASTSKSAAKSHSARKHHAEPPPDDPQPMSRAHGKRPKRDAIDEPAVASHKSRHGQPAETVQAKVEPVRKPVPRSAAAVHPAPHEQANAVQTAHADTGLTESDFIRGARSAQPAPANAADTTPALASGVSHPDDDERLPMHAGNTPVATARTQRPAPVVRAQAPGTSTAALPMQEESGASDASAGEAEIRAAIPAPARAGAVMMPRESPAEQERDLRDAADAATRPLFVPLYNRDGKLLVPPPLKGNHDILVHQNVMADNAGLSRIQDDDDLNRMRRSRLLVDFAESASLHVNDNLPANRRSARPWTVKFASDVARAFYAHFGQPLQVNSAVRTVAYQLRLQRVNGNAAAVDGEGASPHLTGQAIDFGKRGMSVAQIAWMRSYLLPLIDAGKIDVEEEFQQACFHISVYGSYAPAQKAHATPKTEVADNTRPAHSHVAPVPATEADGDLR